MDSQLSKETIDGMTLEELFRALPAPRKEPGARGRIRERVLAKRTLVAVIDDDPTGTQTVHDVPVCFAWSPGVLEPIARAGDPLVFISTNSRALGPGAAFRAAREAAGNASRAARGAGRSVALVSRSDSTLRGHFPREVEGIFRGLREEPDIVVIAPAFFEGGRYTVCDVHWVLQGGRLVPAGKTEFARDPAFGYASSDLRLWVEEKTAGRVKARSVLSVPLDAIRTGGPDEVARLFRTAPRPATFVINACADEDLEVVALGILEAEDAGRRFVGRTAASFVKARAGVPDRGLLSPAEIGARGGPVLFVAGSYVQRTSRQLDALLATGRVEPVEFRAEAASSRRGMASEAADAARRVSALLRQGRSVVFSTSRGVDPGRTGRDFLRFGAEVMRGLCAAVAGLTERPSVIVAKGGITSIEVARSGLGVRDARVAGQALPGVPVWRLGTGCRFPGLPYVVFPGNVGEEGALRDLLGRLEA
jgi:uncharacterized protein YgbK (DUF1537 family)